MAEKKMTKMQKLEGIASYFKANNDIVLTVDDLEITSQDLLEYANNEIAILTKKYASSKSNKNAQENETLKAMLLEELEKVGAPITITDLMHKSEIIGGYVLEDGRPLSNQKISAIFSKLVDDKVIVKTIDKKKSYFSINLDN